MDRRFYFLALAPTGIGISGSDRIFIELARNWTKKIPVSIYTTSEGIAMTKRQKLFGKYLKIVKIEKSKLPSSFFLKYLYKIFLGIKLGLSLTVNHQSSAIYLYSSSDFWMDVFPAVLLKIRNPKLKWVATWYQTAPNPFKGYIESSLTKIRARSYKFSAILYWFSQLIVKPLIKKYADFVIVNNEDERKRFPEFDEKKKVIVLLGAVSLDKIEEYKKIHKFQGIDNQLSGFDAVFQGRFHPQKGVLELIDIWKKVVEKKFDAKLAMIGDGPLFEDVKLRIKDFGLEKNVGLFGYVFDGPKKYGIFSRSKIVVHPSFYDSGGMASAEAMAFGLPCIGFNLKAYEFYYPKGIVKVKIGDIDAFAKVILKFLDDSKYRKKIGYEALQMIKENWSWEKRADEVFKKISKNVS